MTDNYVDLRAALERVEKFHHPDVIASWSYQAAAVRALLADYDGLRDALTETQAALKMIAMHSGSEKDFMGTMRQVREYASQWARIADAALAQEQEETKEKL